MWAKISSFIIRNRILLLILLAMGTAFMAYHASNVKLAYDFPRVIPDSDEDFQQFQDFKKQFNTEGHYVAVGIESNQFFQLPVFNEWYQLQERIEGMEGITSVTSINNILNLHKQKQKEAFAVQPVIQGKPGSQSELDSLQQVIQDLPFYKGLFYNSENHATFMAIRMDDEVLTSKLRKKKIDQVVEEAVEFENETGLETHYSGIPYIRTMNSEKIKTEIKVFSVVAILVTSLFLLIFFRSLYAVIFPLTVIVIVIISSFGTIELLDYRITTLTGLIPPLITIIGVPNFIYFLNKYHNEYHKHGHKMLAITRMVQKLGVVIFLTNVTTAIGFGVLYFTDSPILKEFGLVTSINVLATFVVSLIVIPVIFSLLPSPSRSQTKYLQNSLMKVTINRISQWVSHYRPVVYASFILIVIAAGIGMTKLKAVGYILDDLPEGNKISQHLQFFEDHFNGILPFEVTVNTGQAKGLRDMRNLEKIDQLQDSIETYPEFSRTLSLVDFVKFAKQAYYNGNPNKFELPSRRERSFMSPYLNSVNDSAGLAMKMVDSNRQVARISTKIEDAGSVVLRQRVNQLQQAADSIFTQDATQVNFTGQSLIFLKSNQYLIKSLIYSLTLAFILISIIMGLLFAKVRMIVISLIPNFIPLLLTAGIMGFAGIPLKPSTVLVFSIAFGISVDDALHFLVKYRQELKNHNWDIQKTVDVSLRETGVSMIYTSLVLFFGFTIFLFSSFGGTTYLGLLTSITLLIAMVTNLVLLPSLIRSFDRKRSSIVEAMRSG